MGVFIMGHRVIMIPDKPGITWYNVYIYIRILVIAHLMYLHASHLWKLNPIHILSQNCVAFFHLSFHGNLASTRLSTHVDTHQQHRAQG
jgi:hypothetical protein